MKIEELVTEAINGNKEALEDLIASIQEKIYYLSLRMLVNPENAKDATQEVLIKIITNLSSFRFDSQFETWVYRIAANHLITEKKILAKDPGLTFSLFKEDLESDLQPPADLQHSPDYQVLLNELRISCTMAMLLCLNPSHRMAYILGDIFELEHSEASTILSISKDNFRKQLSRARAKVVDFTSASCGLVSDCANCSCEKKLTGAITHGRVNPTRLFYSNKGQYSYNDVKVSLLETQKSLKALSLQKSIKYYKSPIELGAIIENIVVDTAQNLNKIPIDK